VIFRKDIIKRHWHLLWLFFLASNVMAFNSESKLFVTCTHPYANMLSLHICNSVY
jgi:hypothetical protein